MNKVKYPVINDAKECGNCGLIKPITEFYRYKNYYRSYCKDCAYVHTKKRREDPIKVAVDNKKLREYYKTPAARVKKLVSYKQRLLRIKRQAVDYKGCKCSICGYNKCLTALEFHHLDPGSKEKSLNTRGIDRRKSLKTLKPELDKCILVCCRCHREIHENMRNNE